MRRLGRQASKVASTSSMSGAYVLLMWSLFDFASMKSEHLMWLSIQEPKPKILFYLAQNTTKILLYLAQNKRPKNKILH